MIVINKLKPYLAKFISAWRRDNDGSVRETIEELIEEGEEGDFSLVHEEKNLLSNVLKLRDLTADDICIPRADIVAAPIDSSFEELVKIFAKSQFARMPIYREGLDDVVGYLHIRDLLACAPEFKKVDYESLMEDVLFVAPSMRLLDLLLQMRATRVPMAIVVDEFGGVDGLVTAWNIIREIIGDLEADNGSFAAASHMTRMSDGSVLVNARMDIEDFEKKFGSVLTAAERQEEDIDTVGGLVVSLVGRVPAQKEVISHPSGVDFEVLEADPRRVKRLRVRRVQPVQTKSDVTE